MLADRIEAKWIDAFRRVFALCGVAEGEPVAILSETQSRQLNVHLAELALARLGAKVTAIDAALVPVLQVGTRKPHATPVVGHRFRDL